MFALIMASMMFVMIPRASVSAKRINEVLETEPAFLDGRKRKKQILKKGHSSLNMSSSATQVQKNQLYQISALKAERGETTAIIGGNWFREINSYSFNSPVCELSGGTIRLNGVDIRSASQEEIRAKIGFVPQKAVLFTGMIADNIRFGKQDATQEEIEHAATIAQAHEFISKMKDGYQAEIEQGGSNVSGGQKQRLAIARALVRKPDIYIFDDSFSALDYKTDAKLRAALKEETRDAAVLIVAQRVSTVIDADQIIVLDHGKIVGMGKHKDLLETNEVYREIVASQLSEEEIA